MTEPLAERTLGRYALCGEIASGGMATVYYGRLQGDVGFSRVVAIKRMLPRLVQSPEFVAMFLDEARLASRIQHPNVVSTLDVVADGREVFIVMEYVHGLSLAELLRAAVRLREPVPVHVAVGIMTGVLAGLHAAHEARGKEGELLHIVHRDVSPHNVLVGADGVARIMDFGIAKAAHRLQVTQDGQIKGKLSYMAPEQLGGGKTVDRGADVFAAGVVLWNALAGERLFRGADMVDTMTDILQKEVPPLARYRSDVPAPLEAAIRRALERDRGRRWPSARDFGGAIEDACPRPATARAVSAWVESLAAGALAERRALIARMESAGAASARELEQRAAAAADRRPLPAEIRARADGATDTISEQPTIELAAPGGAQREGDDDAGPRPAAPREAAPDPARVSAPPRRRSLRIGLVAFGACAAVAAVVFGAAWLRTPAPSAAQPGEREPDRVGPRRDPVGSVEIAPPGGPGEAPPPEEQASAAPARAPGDARAAPGPAPLPSRGAPRRASAPAPGKAARPSPPAKAAPPADDGFFPERP